jgi:LDH2 family malate/lactate/ureidoglycolate dehydrogenase
LLTEIKATPLQPGVSEIRVPSERAFAERERRQGEGFTMTRQIYERINHLC